MYAVELVFQFCFFNNFGCLVSDQAVWFLVSENMHFCFVWLMMYIALFTERLVVWYVKCFPLFVYAVAICSILKTVVVFVQFRFLDLKNKEAMKIWDYVEKFVELDKLGEKTGNELDVFFSAKFLESFDQTLTATYDCSFSIVDIFLTSL